MSRPQTTSPPPHSHLDKFLFFCLVIGIFSSIVIQGAEAKGGGEGAGDVFETHAAGGVTRKGSAISSAKSTYKYRAGGYHGGGTYGRGVVDENLPWWKLTLIISAVCLMVFCILLLCFCIRAQQEPDERQAKVTEFLKNQEQQRAANYPLVPQPILFPASNSHKTPTEPATSTTTLLPPDGVTASSSAADAPVGFYISPEIQQVYASEGAATASASQHQPLERY